MGLKYFIVKQTCMISISQRIRMILHCHTNLNNNTALNEVIKIDYSTSTSVKLPYQNTIESL